MQRAGKYVKATGERKRYEIDYSDWLDPVIPADGLPETVSLVTYTVANQTAGSPLTVSLIIFPEFTAVQMYVGAGLTGTTYEVIITMTTSGGQVREDLVVFVIREPT